MKHPLAHMLTPSLSCEVIPGAITNRIRIIGTRGRDTAARVGGLTPPRAKRTDRRWRRVDRPERRRDR